MQLISSHAGKLIRVDASIEAAAGAGFSTGLGAIDRLLPAGRIARGAIHEILWEPGDPRPFFFAAVLAHAAHRGMSLLADPDHGPDSPLGRKIIWCDPAGEIYPPALWAAGIAPDQLLLLRPPGAGNSSAGRREGSGQLLWAIGQCLACRGVAATLAQAPPLSRIQARRLQLLAQSGGGCGFLLRPRDAGAAQHAAATRWLVAPAPGDRTVQRWKIQLIGGHGGRLHCPVYLECSRDQANRLRATDRLADHLPQAPPAQAVQWAAG